MTPEEAQAMWNSTGPNTPKDNIRAFAEFVFSVYPSRPRAMRIRRESGHWEEDYVHDVAEALEAADRLDRTCDQYIIPNPLTKKPAGMQTSGDEIERLCFRLYDLDATHVGGDINACAEQMEELVHYLEGKGHDKPLIGFTGNGYALIERIDAPNTDHELARSERLLKALKARWLCIDTSTYNAARLFRFIGTTNMSYKSAGKDGRPKRSRLITPHGYLPTVIA